FWALPSSTLGAFRRRHEWTKVHWRARHRARTLVLERHDPMPHRPLISIVDDDLSVRRALRRLVQSASYAVDTFASAREFLDASPFARPACLALDLCVGGMSGFELQERLAVGGG